MAGVDELGETRAEPMNPVAPVRDIFKNVSFSYGNAMRR
jgi:hypothetical protein